MESVYIETSVVSYLVATASSGNAVVSWRQQLTKEWWATQREQFTCVISQEVIAEAQKGDPRMAAMRLQALKDLPLISGAEENVKLAKDLVFDGLFPATARSDALHLAVATCARVDYLLTWNFRHLANARVLQRLEVYLADRGWHLPRVCTPEELMGV